MPVKLRELRFPAAGVVRRIGYRATANINTPHPAQWAANVVVEDNIAKRLRGGSRPGLTKFLGAQVGTAISEMVPIQTSSASGTEEMLVVLVDETFGVVSGGVLSFLVAVLKDESGNNIVTEGGDRIVLSDSDAPTDAFLTSGQQHVFAVSSGSVVKLDPKTGTISSLSASAGSVPTDSTFGCVYRDRLVLAGGDNAIYMSRQGDFTDWDYAADVDDGGRAIPFQLSGASLIGALTTALIPHKDAYVLAATARTLWVVQGDPAANGSLRRVSEDVGIIADRAWCKVGDTVVFLAEDGLYQVGADGSGLKDLSGDRLPEELQDVNTATTTIRMEYRQDSKAIYIFVGTAAGGDTHWIYELVADAFWPVFVQDTHIPTAVCKYGGELLIACEDGYIRQAGGDDDDGTAIESHVLLGPIRLGGPDDNGLIQKLHGITATGSGEVTCRIVTGETADEAAANGKAAIEAFQAGSSYASYVKATIVYDAGRSRSDRPRVAAMWACIWLQSTAQWAYENMTMKTDHFGRWRNG